MAKSLLAALLLFCVFGIKNSIGESCNEAAGENCNLRQSQNRSTVTTCGIKYQDMFLTAADTPDTECHGLYKLNSTEPIYWYNSESTLQLVNETDQGMELSCFAAGDKFRTNVFVWRYGWCGDAEPCIFARVEDEACPGVYMRWWNDTEGVMQQQEIEQAADKWGVRELEWKATYNTGNTLERRVTGGTSQFDCVNRLTGVKTADVNATCSGYDHITLEDRVWPSNAYIPTGNWTGEEATGNWNDTWTSDRYNECKMYRVIESSKNDTVGFYVQHETNVGSYALHGDVETYDRVLYNGRTIFSDCDSDMKCETRYATARQFKKVCATSADYCAYMTIDKEATQPECRGHYRLTADKTMTRFELETEGQRSFLDLSGITLKIVETDLTSLNVTCHVNHEEVEKVVVPRAQCFVKGEFSLDQLNYDPLNSSSSTTTLPPLPTVTDNGLSLMVASRFLLFLCFAAQII